MKRAEKHASLRCAVEAARAAGRLMRLNQHRVKRINSEIQHDIKLELDVRCQKLIERTLTCQFPEIAILGEEGTLGRPDGSVRWVVDPIDGTVNFAYGIPHACVSIALQRHKPRFAPAPLGRLKSTSIQDDDAAYETIVGVVLDPFADEIWTAIRGGAAHLNGRVIRASTRTRLDHAIVSLGFAKSKQTLARTLPAFSHLIHRVRKIRVMGAAALAMVYVASGRFDAYIESGLRLWDIAAGGLILECAGGNFQNEQLPGKHTYGVIANNGPLRKRLMAITRSSVRRRA